MKVFITGGTGFIGRHLVRRMVQTGHELICLARRSSDTKELADLGARIVLGDVTDKASLKEGMRGCEWVLNLANVYTMWEHDKSIYRRVNVDGTRNVMECALEAGVSKVVHVSTAAVWGTPEEAPFREETPVAVFRESEYSRTKYAGELIVWQLHREQDLPVVMIHPCMVLGSGDTRPSGELLKLLIEGRMPATVFPDAVITFVHVHDVADAILRAAEKANILGEKYIIGKTRFSLREVYALVGNISGVAPPKLRMPDFLVMPTARVLTWIADRIKRPPLWGMAIDAMREMRHGWIADGSKAERELGIVYTPIRTAIEDEVAWFRMSEAERTHAIQAQGARAWAGAERRRHDRKKAELLSYVEGLSHGQEAEAEARITNLSPKGLYVETDTPLDEGTDTVITAIQFGETFWVMGKVLRSTGKGMAVGFEHDIPREIDDILNSGRK